MPKKWNTLESKEIFGNSIFGFRQDKVESPKTGKHHPIWVMDAPSWVNIIPITLDKKIIMVNQYRFGSKEISLEIPGGVTNKGETPKEAALRELREETGYESNKVFELGRVFCNPALMSNYTFSFLALDVENKYSQELDDMEDIEILIIDMGEIPKLIKSGQINHSLVITAFYLLKDYNL